MTTWRRSILWATVPVLVAGGLALTAGDAGAQRAPVRRAETTLEAYRSALETWMPAEAKQRLRAVSLDRTAGAPPAPLAWIAADFAVRWYASTGLTALGHHPAAARLRGLAPVASLATATVALRELRTIIIEIEQMPGADRAAERSGLAALRAARRAVQEASDANRPADPAATAAALAVTPDEHARQAMQIAAGAAEEAVRAGADREAMIGYCIQNLSDMAEQGRGRAARITH